MLDALPLLNAVIKESCRLHAIFSTLARVAGEDDVIPLSFPVQTQSGALIYSITVRKGQSVGISICAYNRIRALWGEDAHEWSLDRWLNEGIRNDTVNIGVHANLLAFCTCITFLHERRACHTRPYPSLFSCRRPRMHRLAFRV